jgi:hypothetical protein
MDATMATTEAFRIQIRGGAVTSPRQMGDLYRPLLVGSEDERLTNLQTLYDFWIDNVPDPDEALAQDPNILEKLHNQSDVVACMEKRAKTVAGFGWKINPSKSGGDEQLAHKIAQYVASVFDRINMMRVIEEMQRGILPGGVGHEWLWHKEADDSYRPAVAHAIHKTRILFDREGNLCLKTRQNPVYGSYTGYNPTDPSKAITSLINGVPHGRITYHMYRAEPGTWYKPQLEGYSYFGRGLDVDLYLPVTFDQYVQKAALKWIEKYGNPPTFIYHPSNDGPAVKAQMALVLASLRGESVVTIPRDTGENYDNRYHIERPPIPGPAFDAFTSFYEKRTRPAIAAIILGSGDELIKTKSGGYSDHVSRRDSGPMVLFKADSNNIENTLNSQLIPSIVRRGPFGNAIPFELFPKFELDCREERDRMQEASIIERVSKIVPLKETEVYDRIGFTPPEKDDRTIFYGLPTGKDGDGYKPLDNATELGDNAEGGVGSKEDMHDVGVRSDA